MLADGVHMGTGVAISSAARRAFPTTLTLSQPPRHTLTAAFRGHLLPGSLTWSLITCTLTASLLHASADISYCNPPLLAVHANPHRKQAPLATRA
jgi:hypothetical protein